MDQKSSTLLQNIATAATILTIEPNRRNIEEKLLKLKNAGTAYYFVVGPTSTINIALDAVSKNSVHFQ